MKVYIAGHLVKGARAKAELMFGEYDIEIVNQHEEIMFDTLATEEWDIMLLCIFEQTEAATALAMFEAGYAVGSGKRLVVSSGQTEAYWPNTTSYNTLDDAIMAIIKTEQGAIKR